MKDDTESELEVIRKIAEDFTFIQKRIKTALSYLGYDILGLSFFGDL